MNNGIGSLIDIIDISGLMDICDEFHSLTGAGILIVDEDGMAVVRSNGFSGYCRDHASGQPEDCSACPEVCKDAMESAAKSENCITITCRAGFLAFAIPLIANGRVIGGIIGGQVPAERRDEFEKYTAFLQSVVSNICSVSYNRFQLAHVNAVVKNEADMKSEYLTNMSHEIRTPMNAVIGMAELASREEIPQAARNCLSQIKRSGHTILKIINDILDFSKIESGRMDITFSAYSPMEVIHDVANMAALRLNNKDTELIFDVNPQIPRELLGDPTRLKQVLINLCSNAIKFTKQGRVLVQIDFEPISKNEIKLITRVIDTGIGMTKDVVSRLFTSFSRSDSKKNRDVEGSGLGLAISKQMVELMGGSIAAESVYGEGSVLSFVIPQRIVSGRKSIERHEGDTLKCAGFVNGRYVAEQLKKDIQRLGGEYSDIDTPDSVKEFTDRTIDYVFIEQVAFSDELIEFVTNNSGIKFVLITDYHKTVYYDIPNLIVVKKPVYILNLASIFNFEEADIRSQLSLNDSFEFTAPDARILIVDDNSVNLTVACGLLEPLKMKIDTAMGGKEAIEMISNQHYDLIFMDHMMPEIDGVETTHIIRRFHSEYDHVPIIALTANAVEGKKQMFLNEGMNDFVAKPIELPVIVAQLRKWLPREKIVRDSRIRSSKSAEVPVTSITIPGLDIKYALSLLGSEKVLWEVLEEFYRIIPVKYNSIMEAWTSGDMKKYVIEIHALKSASRQVGATELARLSADLEEAGENGEQHIIDAYTEGLLDEYMMIARMIRPYIQSEEENETEEYLPISAEELFSLFDEMYEALNELDMDRAEEIVCRIKKHAYNNRETVYRDRLAEACDNLDVYACEAVMSEWKDAVTLWQM